MPAGASWMRNGTDVVITYRTILDSVGIIPYLHQHLLASGSSAVKITQRAVNGASVNDLMSSAVPLLIQDYRTRGVAPQTLIYWQGEAETLNVPSAEAAKYEGLLDAFCRYIWGYYPSCRIVLVKLLMRTNDYGGTNKSIAYPQIIAAQNTVAARYPTEITAIDPRLPVAATLSDDVHATTDAAGMGVVAQRIVTTLAAG